MQRLQSIPRVRAAVLVVAAIGAVVRGLGYLDPTGTGMTLFVDGLLPLTAWAAVWITAGAFALAGIWSRPVARWGLSIIAALWFTWFVSYMAAWISGDSTRGWLTAGGFFVIAVYSWIFAYLIERPGKMGEPWNG